MLGTMTVLDLVVPPACSGCGQWGALVCDGCRRSFTPPGRNDDAFLMANPGAVVGEALTLAAAALTYDGPLRRCLARLKYVGTRRVATTLADAARPAFDRLLAISGRVPIAAVPAHPERLGERGYNQAALLADALASRADLQRIDPLVRRRSTERQHRLDRAARLRNLESAFAVASGARVPTALIVVDDILTTSATLEACARVLRRHGAELVYGFAIAREV
jgi:ComF family protein